ncbi:hypothetical protein WJX73_009909 [Symbiochloris irregularis]|uniref:AB hydrolase-1 domain-containing protein n=1 Tax=Symbiochloris irregularis TaxID=706552 RepID=A0AAW1PM06_9CHLO
MKAQVEANTCKGRAFSCVVRPAPVWPRVVKCRAANVSRYSDARFHLQDGTKLELQHTAPTQTSRFPPLLLVHGSYHGAWCWQERFMPYLASKGIESFAMSLRGQGLSDRPDSNKGSSLAEHAHDIAELVKSMSMVPVIVAHSFGGLVVQRLLLGAPEDQDSAPTVAGMALFCSASPNGNQGVFGRFFMRNPWNAIQLAWSFITKNFLKSDVVCRRMFFSDDLSEEELTRYQGMLKQHASPVPVVNLSAMRKEVPLLAAREGLPPIMVLGGARDCILDEQAVQETAQHYGVQALIMDDMAHDCMLDTQWQQAADHLVAWVSSLEPAGSA